MFKFVKAVAYGFSNVQLCECKIVSQRAALAAATAGGKAAVFANLSVISSHFAEKT